MIKETTKGTQVVSARIKKKTLERINKDCNQAVLQNSGKTRSTGSII